MGTSIGMAWLIPAPAITMFKGFSGRGEARKVEDK